MSVHRVIATPWELLAIALAIGATVAVAAAAENVASGADGALVSQQEQQERDQQQQEEPARHDDGARSESERTDEGPGTAASAPSPPRATPAPSDPPASTDGSRDTIEVNPSKTIDDITALDPVTNGLPPIPGLVCRVDITVRNVSVCI